MFGPNNVLTNTECDDFRTAILGSDGDTNFIFVLDIGCIDLIHSVDIRNTQNGIAKDRWVAEGEGRNVGIEIVIVGKLLDDCTDFGLTGRFLA